MAKAHLTTKSGTTITIEGTQEEVASLIALFDGGAAKPRVRLSKRRASVAGKSGPVDLISELIDGGFFKKPKELGSIKLALGRTGSLLSGDNALADSAAFGAEEGAAAN